MAGASNPSTSTLINATSSILLSFKNYKHTSIKCLQETPTYCIDCYRFNLANHSANTERGTFVRLATRARTSSIRAQLERRFVPPTLAPAQHYRTLHCDAQSKCL
jgi:hypothetical protein